MFTRRWKGEQILKKILFNLGNQYWIQLSFKPQQQGLQMRAWKGKERKNNKSNQYDIVFLSETWITHEEEDELMLTDFCKPEVVLRSKSIGGGIVLYYKKWLLSSIKIEKKCADTYMWIKVDKNVMGYDQDLFICFCYLPDEKSNTVLLGDLNSRNGNLTEKLENDKLYGIPYPQFTERKSDDYVVNNFGRKLMQLCRSTGTIILNGRTFYNSPGSITFYSRRRSSIIDYAILCKNMWSLVDKFAIDDFNSFSDHAPVILDYPIKAKVYRLVDARFVITRVEWNGSNGMTVLNDSMREKLLDVVFSQ
ncbi:hypothetical protein KUTeg_016567 [Tegillarca granosa]|uniref:Endonuclease/exonuclease/phosphatase domain-containing protein n=1 Tax=Tegillarca granosa TaxID=220873 RepID=A0ABQ9EL84_TEGGR|nr:hypothetical protein KUTeg_016567 [Tegillarca granosa]